MKLKPYIQKLSCYGMNLIWCRITAKYLVQNKKQISAKKAENLHCVNFWVNFANFYPNEAKIGSNRLGQYRTIQPIKKPLNIEFKGFFIFQWTTSERILVEVAGVEPASASTTLENTTCLDIVYCFNSL